MVSMPPHDQHPYLTSMPRTDTGYQCCLCLFQLCVFHRNSTQSSPLTSPLLNTSLASFNPSEEAITEIVVPKTSLFSTKNTKYNTDNNSITLSVPCEKTPEKMAEKYSSSICIDWPL
jgi:hypothetical protein